MNSPAQAMQLGEGWGGGMEPVLPIRVVITDHGPVPRAGCAPPCGSGALDSELESGMNVLHVR